MNRFISLYITNFLSVLNDNVLKTLVCFIGVAWVDDNLKSLVVSASAGALVLPYLFFSPLAGKLPNYCNKKRIIRIAKWAEIPIMLVALCGFYYQSIIVAISAIVLMGLQSALFSPAKYGLIKDIGGVSRISQGMGGMEAVSFTGILLGTVIASFMAEHSHYSFYCSVLIGVAILGALSSHFIKAEEQPSFESSSANPLRFIRNTHLMLKQYEGMNGIIHLLSLFWWLSATLQIVIILYADDTLNLSPSKTGYIMALIAIAISLGCLLGGFLDKRHYMLGAMPFVAIMISILLLLIFTLPMSPILFTILAFGVAFLGGVFKIPLDAEIQKRIETSKLNIVLAYFNLISFIYIFLASATTVLVTSFLPTRYVFLTLAIVFGIATLIFVFNYRPILCFFGRTFIRLHYKPKHINRHIINSNDSEYTNMLILPQHTAVIDPLLIFAELYNVKLQPLVDEGFFKIPPIKHVLGLFNAVEVPDLRLSRKGFEKAKMLDSIVTDALSHNENILFYPSGHITTDGKERIGARHLAFSACSNLPTHTKVVAIRIRGLWGSKWSRHNRTATPSIVMLLALSFICIFSGFFLFLKRRPITLEYIDITNDARTWATSDKMTFNRNLEALYNNDSVTNKI